MKRLIALAILALACAAPAAAQLRGHGGPVRAVAAAQDGTLALSSGFDGSAIVWGLGTGQALAVLRPHDAPATAAAISPGGMLASGDQNGRVAVWRLGAEPRLIEAHRAPVAGLAATPDGRAFFSAGLDGVVSRIDADSGAAAVLTASGPPLAAICAQKDGAVAATREGEVRWLGPRGETRRMVATGAPILAMACGTETVIVGTAEGRALRVAPDGAPRELFEMGGPVTALTAKDGLVAAATATGEIAVFDDGRRRPFAAKRGRPVWGLAVAGAELLAAGDDGYLRRFDLASGREAEPAAFAQPEEIPAALRDHPGAAVFEACRACHSLRPGENRAGPTLAGVIGRKIATAPGYAFSDALKRMEIVWSEQTIARLFEIGPAAMTPGTKMPEQRVTDAADRAALADFIAKAGGR